MVVFLILANGEVGISNGDAYLYEATNFVASLGSVGVRNPY